MINPVIYRFIKKAVASNADILAAASKYYDNDDPEDPKRRWDHVLDDIEVAKKIRGRELTPVELATLAFHDSGYKNPKGYMWGLKHHPSLGRKIFKKEAPGLGFTDDEIKHMAKVITYHMRTPKKNSPLLKDDLQMLMFGADEGSPKKPVDDARKYFMKAINGRYPEVPDKDHPDFIKKLVERVRTFRDYSNAPGLAYYHKVYPNYHRDLYNYWHSDQLEKDYKKMLEDAKKGKSIKQKSDKKKEKKKKVKEAEFDLPDLQVNPKNKITRLLKNLKWGVKVDGKPDSTDELLFTMDPKKKYEVIGDDNSDLASCVDLTNRVVKNIKDVGSLVTLRSDSEIPHITPMFKHKGKYYLRSGSHKYSDPYDSLDEIGDRWFTRPNKYPPPEYIDFYDLPAGETIDEKDLRKIINEVKKKSKKTYRKSYTDRPGYKKEKKASRLYTYVDPDADLSLGILSARQAPEDVLLRRYPGRAKSKKELLALMQERLDDKDRPDLIYALSEPIPDRATEKLRRFRDARKLVSYDTDDIKDLIKILKRNYRKPPSEVKDVEHKKYIQWGRKPKDGGAFFYAPVYKLLTESGKISPELLTIEDNDKYSIHGAILGCLGKNAKKFKYNITEDLPGDPWKAIINTGPVDINTVKRFHKYHNIDVDKAGVPYYFLTNNNRTGEKAVWFSDSDKPVPINNKKEIEKAKKIGLAKGLKEEQLDFKFN